MENNEDKGRFLKDILYGVPTGYGLSRGEQTVQQLSRISRTLNSFRSQLPAALSSPTAVIQAPQIQQDPALRPALQAFETGQYRISANTEELVDQGSEHLELERTLVGLGVGQAKQNRMAIDQRDEMIGQGEITIENLRTLVGNSQTANALLQTLGEQGFISLLTQAGILQQGGKVVAQGEQLIRQGTQAARACATAQSQRATLIDNSRLAITVLESLDTQGQNAYMQRLRLVSEVAQTRGAIEVLGDDLVKSGEKTHRGIAALHAQGDELLRESRDQTSLLADVRSTGREHLVEARGQTNMLSGIQTSTADHLAESRIQTRALGALTSIGAAQLSVLTELSGAMGTAVSILGDIDYGITRIDRGITRLNATADQAVGHLEHVSHALDMFVMTAHAIHSQLTAITQALHRPVSIRAHNLWDIGERCRQAGDVAAATGKFLESHNDDPSYYRNYYSLAMVSLEIGDVDIAEDLLLQALVYARQSGPKAEVEVLHILGKIEFMTHRQQKALEHLYQAYEKDPNIFPVWYDIALTETTLGDSQAALGFLKALVRVAKVRIPDYITKIKAEPLFRKFITQLAI